MKADPRSFWRVRGRFTARAYLSLWTVVGLLGVSELVYVRLVRFDAVGSTRSVATFLVLIAILFMLYGAAYLVLQNNQASRRGAVLLVLVGAILFRVTLLFVGIPPHATWREATARLRTDIRSEGVTFDSYLLFDNDIWRYLWDGHVGAHGINPYKFEPRNPKLDALAESTTVDTHWADIRANINHPEIPTIYPPFAQLAFRVAHVFAPGSVFAMKSLLVLCDLLTILLISLTLHALNRPVTDVVLYAWNPLLIKAVAASGHMDAILAMLLAAMIYFAVRRWHSATAIAWGLSVLAKVSPIILLPFLLRRLGWRKTAIGVAVVVAGYAPYLGRNGTQFAGLRTFASEWQFNSGFFSLVESLASPLSSHPILLARAAAVMTFLVLMMWLIHLDDANDNTFAFCCASAFGGLLVLSPTVMPWYLVSIVPLAVVARSSAWIQFSLLICLSFLVMIDGVERAWVLWVEFGTVAVLVWRELRLWGKQQQTRSAHNIDALILGGQE